MLEIRDVSDIDIAFGNCEGILPKWEDIPKEFKNGHTKWNELTATWFFLGLKNVKYHPKEGVDVTKAMRMIKACLGSFSPKHEHKDAGVAYMLSEFFNDIEYEPGKNVDELTNKE